MTFASSQISKKRFGFPLILEKGSASSKLRVIMSGIQSGTFSPSFCGPQPQPANSQVLTHQPAPPFPVVPSFDFPSHYSFRVTKYPRHRKDNVLQFLLLNIEG